MAKKDKASKPSIQKKQRKTIQPDSEPTKNVGEFNSEADLEEINKSLKAMDSSLEPDNIKKVDDGGNDMPRLVSSDGEDLEQSSNDIMEGETEPFSDELADKIEKDESEDQVESEEFNKGTDESDDVQQETESEKTEQEDDPAEKVSAKSSGSTSPNDEDGIKDDPELDKAINEITAKDSDAVLEAEDKSQLSESVRKSKKERSGIFGQIADYWATKRGKYTIIGGLFLIILLIALIPNTRYYTLNAVGVRSTMTITVVDSGTLQPIKNVSVKAGGADGLTNEEGIASLEQVKLGRTNLQVDKRAFDPVNQPVTIGWGSNPLGEYRVEAVGAQYTVIVKDSLSGKPIARAQASSGDGNATSDDDGQFVLTLDTAGMEDSAELSILISADNYREETLNITVNNRETQEVKMVPARKHIYVSKRSGKYDVYTAHIDSKNEDKIVGGSGLERDDIALVPYQGGEVAAFVSTRENARNASGYLLSTLYIIETDSGDITKIDQSEKIQIIGWSSQGRLIYVKIASGASGTDPSRHRIMSFNSNDYSGFKELAASNAFHDVVMARDKVYYAPSNVFQENPEPGAFVISPTGEDKSRLLNKETFSIVRAGYDEFYLSTGNDWFTFSPSVGGEAKPAEAPSSQVGRIYQESPDGSKAAWIDERDGKGVLIIRDNESGEEKTLLSRGGVNLPMYWLNEDYIVFRVFDGSESADYVVNILGGDARKITDVTNTSGVDRWFYY